MASAAARRSPLTSVRSEASIATSVPVPIDEAEVGLGECRRVVDAVAGHRDDATFGLQAPDDVGLVGRHDLGDHLVDADLGGDGARGRRVVAGEQHGAQAERLELGDRLGRGRLDGVGDDEDRAGACPSQPAAMAVWPRASAARRAASSSRGQIHGPVGEQRRAADDQRVTVDDALDAEALAVGEALDGGQRAGGAGRGGDRLGDRMLGGVLERAGESQRLVAVDAVGRDDLDERHLARW